MAACKSVIVLCPNARRQTVKVGPTTTILQILEDVCKKQGLSSQEYAIKYQRKIFDETLPIRYSGLSNNAHLELVQQTKTVKEGVQCTIALQLASGERLVKDFPPAHSLWDVILHWNSQDGSPHHQKLLGGQEQDVVCVYMTQRISGESILKSTTLHTLGLTGKRAIIRLLHEQASVCKPEPVVNEKPSAITQEKVPAPSDSPITVTVPNTTNMEPPTEPPSSCTQVPSVNLQTGDRHRLLEPPTEPPSSCTQVPSVNVQIGDRHRPLEPPTELPSSCTQVPSVNVQTGDRHRPLEPGTVSPDRAARDSKRTRIAGPDPLFPDFKFPEKNESSQPQTPIVTEERLQHLATPCERFPIVFKEDDQTTSATAQGELPDSFYNVTVEDIRKLLQDLKSERTKSEDMPLLTKALRESRQLEEMCKYEKVVIRVKFPDRITLQGFFRPQEKVSVLSEFVKSHLQDPSASFYLYTTPPKTVLKDQDSTLYNVQLCPASLVYFGSTEKKDHFLASHLLSNLASALDAEKTVLDSGIHGSSASAAEPSTSHTMNNVHTSTNTNSTTDNGVTSSEHSNKPPPPSGGSGTKVPKWFKGVGK